MTRPTSPAFHRVYVETAERDRFTPRGLEYFEHMYAALSAEDPDRIRVYLAEHEGDVLAATIWIRVGEHAWYSYGASTAAKRELQASTAIQWRMMRDSLAAGATRLRPARHHEHRRRRTTRTSGSSASRWAPAARRCGSPASGTCR